MIGAFTETYFRTDINSNFLVISASKSNMWKRLNMPSSVGLPRALLNR